MNPADCSLDFVIDSKDGLSCSTLSGTLSEEGFAYCWAGARATLGIRIDSGGPSSVTKRGSTEKGKFYFTCIIGDKHSDVAMADTPEEERRLSWVGLSVLSTEVGCLGESLLSYGYGGSGKCSSAGRIWSYGNPFSTGDVVACLLDLNERSVGFALNGRLLGAAFSLLASVEEETLPMAGGDDAAEGRPEGAGGPLALFPHVLLKNMSAKLQFSREDGLAPLEGYSPWGDALAAGLGVWGPGLGPEAAASAGAGGVEAGRGGQREVLMMVGLPGCGKSTWAERWRDAHPGKRYTILGTDRVLDQMKVGGLRRNYGERWQHFMQQASKVFDKLLERASRMPRNFILDQTNVYQSARIRKLRHFHAFRKVAVVMVLEEEERERRCRNRAVEEAKDVPREAVDEMKANFVLPRTRFEWKSRDVFDEVWFVELPGQEAAGVVKGYRREGQEAERRAHAGPGTSARRPVPQIPGIHAVFRPWAQVGEPSPLPGEPGFPASPAPQLFGSSPATPSLAPDRSYLQWRPGPLVASAPSPTEHLVPLDSSAEPQGGLWLGQSTVPPALEMRPWEGDPSSLRPRPCPSPLSPSHASHYPGGSAPSSSWIATQLPVECDHRLAAASGSSTIPAWEWTRQEQWNAPSFAGSGAGREAASALGYYPGFAPLQPASAAAVSGPQAAHLHPQHRNPRGHYARACPTAGPSGPMGAGPILPPTESGHRRTAAGHGQATWHPAPYA